MNKRTKTRHQGEEQRAMASPTMRYPHIASRVFDTPLLIEHSKLIAILNVLGPRLGFDAPAPLEGAAFEYGGPERHLDMLVKASRVEHRDEGFFVADGVAILPVIGTLVQRADWLDAMSGMVGYGQVERMFVAAVDDPMVREIVIEVDSPGGEVAGAFDLADRMAEARGSKPITAVATEFAASAAYLIASTADKIVVPRTGYVGSVGVVGTHIDYSKALEKRGIAVTFVYAGEKKVDGNPYQPLPASVKKEWQEEIDQVYQLFVETVARNRNVSEEHVRATQAGMFMGSKAVEAGLADRVNSFSNELSNAVLRDSGASPKFIKQQPRKEAVDMKDEQTIKAEAEAKAKAELEAKAAAEAQAKAEADAKSKAAAAAQAKAEADAKAAGAAGDRGRIKAILALDEAKGREAQAQTIALETDLSVDQAKAVLTASPKASRLDDAMRGESPGVGSQETTTDAPKLDSQATVYARRAEVYRQAQRR